MTRTDAFVLGNYVRVLILRACALLTVASLLVGSVLAAAAAESLRVGVIISATGVSAFVGLPMRNVIRLIEDELNRTGGVAGRPVRFIVYDDASDAGRAVEHARRLIQEDQVIAIVGSANPPASVAISGVTGNMGVPQLVPTTFPLLDPASNPLYRWVFATIPSTTAFMAGVGQDMAEKGIRTIGYIGFSDAVGDDVLKALRAIAERQQMRIVAVERYHRTDPSALGQALRVMAARPDAVVAGVAGGAAVTGVKPFIDRGFKGPIYVHTGAATPDFYGGGVDGVYVYSTPAAFPDELPDWHPSKAAAVRLKQAYERLGETWSTSASYAYDAWLVLKPALERALRKGDPAVDVTNFRRVLRDELEATRELVVTGGVFSYSPTDHHGGEDPRSVVLLKVEQGQPRLVRAFR